jgi:hypothetical protein
MKKFQLEVFLTVSSKFALTKTAALEYAKQGIHVDTRMLDSLAEQLWPKVHENS